VSSVEAQEVVPIQPEREKSCHSERSEEPMYFVFAFAVACSLILYTYSKTALTLAKLFWA
jgi:hypothetical protein